MHKSVHFDRIFTDARYGGGDWSMENDSFIDYYEILQVNSNADRDTRPAHATLPGATSG
jgi:hypothetical protein